MKTNPSLRARFTVGRVSGELMRRGLSMLCLMEKRKRSLSGQVALVTGASRGIGKAIALLLGARGVSLVLVGRSERALGEAVGEVVYGGGQARHVVGDVRDPATLSHAVERAVSAFGGLDIAIANAGISGVTALGEAGSSERARAIIDTNLLGTMHTFDAAFRVMREGGRLIAVSSVLAKFGVPGYAAYCASKAGILGLVRAVAHEGGARQITCNAICPGWADTLMAAEGIRSIAQATGVSVAAAKADATQRFPLGRFLEPEEVANFVAYVASPEASGITGQALSICGGSTAFGS